MKKDQKDMRRDSSQEKRPSGHGNEETLQESVEAVEEQAPSTEDETSVPPVDEAFAKLKEDYLRVLAETENIKKRCAAEIEKNNKYAVSSFAKELLGVADNLSRALEAGGHEATECNAILKGVELTQNELNRVFAKFGIVPMESVGAVFDPNFHRVVQEVADPSKPAGTVIAELQKGYLLNGRLLREAMVVVSKNA
jgi:molecular chaperone GrpE